MHKILLMLTLLLPWTAHATDAVLTKTAVSTMLSEMLSAVRRHDANALTAGFTSDARITLVAPARLGGTQQMSVEQYRQALIQGWQVQAGSTYEVSDIVITISADGRSAAVSDTVKETLEMYGKRMSSVSHERMTVVLRGGQPRVTSAFTTISVSGL